MKGYVRNKRILLTELCLQDSFGQIEFRDMTARVSALISTASKSSQRTFLRKMNQSDLLPLFLLALVLSCSLASLVSKTTQPSSQIAEQRLERPFESTRHLDGGSFVSYADGEALSGMWLSDGPPGSCADLTYRCS